MSLVYWRTKVLPHLHKNPKPLIKPTKSHHPDKLAPAPPILESSRADSKPPISQLSTLIIRIIENQRVAQRRQRRKVVLSHLCHMIFLSCAEGLVKYNLIVRTWPKWRTLILKGFDPYAHCHYHMDMSGHNRILLRVEA